ncbi:DUF1515 domain-containing protein [Aminobacter sp. NyZ550]|uniref:DUF1515 domain-containing protein n=1 Tax=Aminobacter sp. NyZ550 TaxID=2979870 RepID=UPI0021D60859|nr:DUF1515 domain-containing protein [Aminobacter sp. NyZ550]WAX95575.1 DUF1515 domain-containing protein [Aminobacter sp. NyZ550]
MSERSTDLLLGRMEGQLEAILDRMDRADESRAGVHRRLDEFVHRLTRVEADLIAVKHSQANMQAVTDDVVNLRIQAQGAGTAGRWLLKAGIGIVGGAGWLLGLYTWLTGRPPP